MSVSGNCWEINIFDFVFCISTHENLYAPNITMEIDPVQLAIIGIKRRMHWNFID